MVGISGLAIRSVIWNFPLIHTGSQRSSHPLLTDRSGKSVFSNAVKGLHQTLLFLFYKET